MLRSDTPTRFRAEFIAMLPFIAWSVTIRPKETIEYFEQPRTVVRVKARLSELLSDVWKDRRPKRC